MAPSLDVVFSPAEQHLLSGRDLSQTVCVVFDVLRATSTMMAALAHGAVEILPVCEIDQALAMRKERPEILLAGERQGLRITAEMTGSCDFDFGNSPREFTTERVRGRSLVMTTTNGTRALNACVSASRVALGSLLGLRALCGWLGEIQPGRLLLVCSGTGQETAFEDVVAAGALIDLLGPSWGRAELSDAAQIARQVYAGISGHLLAAMQNARNGRRLMRLEGLAEDVAFCAQTDQFDFVAALQSDGWIRRIN